MEIRKTENGMFIVTDDSGKEHGYASLRQAIKKIIATFLGSPDINIKITTGQRS